MADKSEKELLERAKRRFKLASESEAKQREREKADLAFAIPENQWSDDARRGREGQAVSGNQADKALSVQLPARPTLTIPKLDQPINLILNQQRQAELGIDIDPISPHASDEVSEVFEGLHRQINRESQGWNARNWAFHRAVLAGRGWYRITPEWSDDPDDEDTDLVIRVQRILRQESVYIDPAAERADFSDARFAFITSWMTLDTFEQDYPGKEVPATDEYADEDQEAPEWVQGEGKERAVQVAEYWEVEFEDRMIEGNGRTRKVREPKVTWYKVCSTGILEGPTPWNGRYIPLVPVLGIEHQPYDSERRWSGLICYGRDAQQVYNWGVSSMVERAALEPKAPFVGDYRQFAGFREFWDLANIRPFSYLPYDSTPEGINTQQPLPPPQRSEVSAAAMTPSMALLQQANDWIQMAMATYDPSLGNIQNRDVPARAIQALQQQGDTTNSGFLHNLVMISMPHEGRIINDMIPRVYDRPGRIVRILDTEEKTSSVMVGAWHLTDPDTGIPYRTDEQGIPVRGTKPTPGIQRQLGTAPKMFDLQRGKYAINVKVGKAYQSRLDQSAEEMAQLMSASPELVLILGPEYLRAREFPGSKEAAELLEAIREMKYPGVGSKKGEEPSPAQMRAMLQRAGMEKKAMQAEMQQLTEYVNGEKAKGETQLQLAEMNNSVKVAIAQLQAEQKGQSEKSEKMLKLLLEALKGKEAGKDRAHESIESTKDRHHESAEAQKDRTHDLVLEASKPPPQPKPPGGGRP